MSALEVMAKAYDSDEWSESTDGHREFMCQKMRVALLALAEVELPYKAVNRGMETYYKAPEKDEAAAFTAGFRAICKALAEEGK